jgi:four helix bundle protein
MNKQELQTRMKNLAIRTARLCMILPINLVNKIYAGQLVRSSSSAAANYRAACRGKSKADFVHKLRVVEEELDETMFFYEMLAEFNLDSKSELRTLYKEADELLSIMVASINTTNKNIEKAKSVKKNPTSPI